MMAVSTAAQLITLEEFISRPEREDDQREELIEGELIVSPGAKPSHAEIVDLVREALALLKQKGYVLRNDFSCMLSGRSMPVPDLAVVLEKRWYAALKKDGWLEGSPELVIEVSSPSNRKLQRKAAIYLNHGAEQVWIIYPVSETVSVLTAKGTAKFRLGDTLTFHGVGVKVDSIMISGGKKGI